MVREADDSDIRNKFQNQNPDLNSDFVFAYAGYNMRNTEIGGIMGLSQLARLDVNVAKRTKNLDRFLKQIDDCKYRVDFKVEGSSNYAFNLILQKPDRNFVERLMSVMRAEGIEFRRGSAGGGNQIRQPYLRKIVPKDYHKEFPRVEHIHFYGFYIGNFPDLKSEEIDEMCAILNSVE